MNIVIDTSALVAVLVGEPEKERLAETTLGHDLIGPKSIPWEVGNAFTAMLKQHRFTLNSLHRALEVFVDIPIRYVETDLSSALTIAAKANAYAYDAYFLECALRHAAPLLTLDRPLRRAARTLGIECLEV